MALVRGTHRLNFWNHCPSFLRIPVWIPLPLQLGQSVTAPLLPPWVPHLSQVTFFCKANLVASSSKSKVIEVHTQHVYLPFLSVSSLCLLQKVPKMSTREPPVPFSLLQKTFLAPLSHSSLVIRDNILAWSLFQFFGSFGFDFPNIIVSHFSHHVLQPRSGLGRIRECSCIQLRQPLFSTSH